MPTYDDRVRALLERHEGRVRSAYKDSLGYLTIGIGHLIDSRRGGVLPDHIIDALFEHDLHSHEKDLFANAPWVAQLDDVRRAVLTDMAFNMGGSFLKKWPNFVSQVRSGDYEKAADNMRHSQWAEQVKLRATRLAGMMETGKWPTDLFPR